MKGKLLRLLQLCAVLALCALLCAGCGKDDGPALGDYFTEDRINAWKEADKDKELKYTMNGGYFLCYQGEYYPVEFQDGVICWQTTPPAEILFVRMNELFTDASLKNRCAYLGVMEHAVLFQLDCQHGGYLLDGKRPDYGSVLYIDETNLRQVFISYGDTPLLGVDDEIKLYRFNGNRAEEIFVCGQTVLSDAKGVFLEELNTFRKIYANAIANHVVFDAYTEYTGIAYPSAMLQVYDDLWWQEDENDDIHMTVTPVTYPARYHATLSYPGTQLADVHCLVLTSDKSVEDFEWAIGLDNGYLYTNVVKDGQGRVTQCYVKNFFGKDQGAEVKAIFYSMEEFSQFIKAQTAMDEQSRQSLVWFSRQENGDAFDEHWDYPFTGGDYSLLKLYAVWKPYRTVQLHTPAGITEVNVCNGQEVALPRAQKPGYEFEGWYADESCSGQPVTMLNYTDSYEHLYPKFRAVDFYTLTLEPYNGMTFQDIQYNYGDTVELPRLNKAFHIFKGWCIDAECQTEPMKSIPADLCGSFHLYPCFEAREYTITVMNGETQTRVNVRYGEEYILPAADAAGFLGYFDIDGVQYTDENGKSLAPFTDGADIQLFARYKEG